MKIKMITPTENIEAKEILERRIKPFGNAAHIIMPKRLLHQNVLVIIKYITELK